MIPVPSWPLFVTVLFRGMPGIWKSRHRLLLWWLVFMPALYPGRKTLADLARWTPASLTAWRFRRLRKASYWNVHVRVAWGVQEALNPLPPPADGVLARVGDGSPKPQRGIRNPLAPTGRISEHPPWVFGIRGALWTVNWEVDRLPVACRLIRPKTQPESQTENALFREMVVAFTPPAWATTVIGAGDAAYGSQENIKMVQQRDANDAARRWGVVCAIARPWTTVEDQAIKAWVMHLPRKYSQRPWGPRLPGSEGRKTFWIYSKRLGLRHSGDVTVVLSKKGRTIGPKQTKILVTNLAEGTPRHVGCAYQRRGPVEQINRELKTDWGGGEHQGRGGAGRIAQSFGIAVIAYLCLLCMCPQEILPGQAWSVSQLQQAFR